jgi:kynurenine formamidase
VKAYAVDTPSSDDLVRMFDLMGEGVVEARELLPVHHALLGAGIPVIEGLVNTGALLSEEDVVFVGFPLKMRQPGGDAGQMRAVALAY